MKAWHCYCIGVAGFCLIALLLPRGSNAQGIFIVLGIGLVNLGFIASSLRSR